MPRYEYEDTSTGETFHEYESWDESQKRLEENPNLRRIIGAVNIVSGVNNRAKIPEWHKDNLRRMKETHKKGDFGQAI
jgi:hypothetical protein